MAVHLIRDLENLKKEILLLGGMVEEATENAILALTDRRPELAEKVLQGDKVVDAKEVQIEEECLKVLALHQPVAADLRYVVAMMKVNNDLERVGDLAKNIAERAVSLAEAEPVSVPQGITNMADDVRGMLRDSLNAVVELDTELAKTVHRQDENIDEAHKRIFRLIEERIRRDPERIHIHIQLLSVSRYLERIADLATNISEDVVFMVNGDVIRHQTV